MQIIYFSGREEGSAITAVAVVSPFSFALLAFTHFQSHREGKGGEQRRGGVRANRAPSSRRGGGEAWFPG